MPPRTRGSNKFTLPRDYTFTPSGIPIHKASLERVEKMLQQTRNRDPDMHDMYINNDYFGDAVLDLVDKTLSTIHTHVVKKRWLDAWHVLDALAKFNNICSSWIDVDDGEHVGLTEAAHGALLVTTIRALDAAGQLNERSIPDLSYTLKEMTEWSDEWWDTLDTCYHNVLEAYGKKLYDERTDEEWQRMRVARENAFNAFVQSLTEEERKKKGYRLVADKPSADKETGNEQEESEGRGWYEGAKVEDVDMKDPSFSVSRTWKEYKEYLRDDSSDVSLCGEPEYDLTEWTESEKKPYKFTTSRSRS